MTRFVVFSALFFAVSAATAFSAPEKPKLTTVKCHLTHIVKDKETGKETEKKEWVKLKIDEEGFIVQWDDDKWGVASKGAYWFDIYEQNIEEYGFEWDNSIKAKNGYSILELGTTADAFKIGVSEKKDKGFFEYKDYGSGNGHTGPLDTTCEVVK